MASIHEGLRLGIEAARSGQHDLAWQHLSAVLLQDEDNVPALLWLAYISPDPEESLRFLQQVLQVDPDNERALAGVRWARARLVAAGGDPDSLATVSLRQQFLSERRQDQAKKGPLAQRARRTVNPLVVFIILFGALSLAAIGFGATGFIPPATLAAWLPARSVLTPARPALGFDAPPLFTGLGDEAAHPALPTVAPTISSPEPVLPELAADLPLLPGETGETLPQEQVLAASLNPLFLIGPGLPLALAGPPAPAGNVALAYQPAYPGEKWIEVNVTTQQVTAWEGETPVMSFVVSTGLPSTPTILGEYRIYWKLKSALMVGADYYLPQVPYTMYFYGSYALHGTYWHSNFGQPMSHGCVNLPTDDAQKLFEWADPAVPAGKSQVVAGPDNPGTLVVVHE